MLFNVALILSLLMMGSAHPAPQNIEKRAVSTIRNCVNSGQVAMTFDDGPSGNELTVSNNLNGGKATFFLNGQNYKCIYDAADDLKALYAAGHTLGSHTWSHKDVTTLSWDQIHDELYRVEEAFIKILGVKPIYFRPPYGNINDLALSALDSRGYKKVFLWSEDSGDSVGASVGQSEGVYDGIASSFPSPHNILNHSPLTSTVNQLVPYAVSKLSNAGYKLVAVDTCMGDQGEWPYTWVGEPQARDDSWHC